MSLELGKTLRDLRSDREFTQAELSERSGVADTIISRIENGRIGDPKISTLERLADGLNITLSRFIELSEKESDSEAVLNKLRDCREVLESQYHVKSIGLFGSVARGESGSSSDVDLLVEYQDGHRDIFNHSRLEEYLETQLGRPVDLVMDSEDARKTHPRIHTNIEDDLIRV